jgi:hypothetical protein
MDTKREFAYERYRRDIYACGNVKDLQDLACKFMRLYMAQLDVVDNLIKKGWLPAEAANEPND